MKRLAFKSTWELTKNGFRCWRTDRRYAAILIALILFVFKSSFGLTIVSYRLGIRISPFAVVLSTVPYHSFFLFGFIFLFANAPFITALSLQEIIRVGRHCWLRAQAVYIALASALYTLILFLMPLLFYAPRLFLTSEWGALVTLVSKDPRVIPRYFSTGINSALLRHAPLRICLWAMVLLFLQGMIIGLLMLTTGVFQKKESPFPVLFAMIYVLVPGILDSFTLRGLRWFPAFLSNISQQKFSDATLVSSYRTPVANSAMLLAVLCLLLALAHVGIRRKEFIVHAKRS